MFRLSQEQTRQLTYQSRQDFLLHTVCEWQAFFEASHERASRIDFDQAWQVGGQVIDQMDDIPLPRNSGEVYALVHAVLRAAEKGATQDQLRDGVAAYLRALPADEAGLILLETICDLPSATGAD